MLYLILMSNVSVQSLAPL